MSFRVLFKPDTRAKALGLALATLVASHGSLASAAPFECVWRPVDADSGGAHDVKSLLPVGDPLDSPARLMAAVDTLRRQGMADVVIIDNLIGEYCPVVAADRSLNDPEKIARVRQFASTITSLVYASEEMKDILLTFPLPPDVVDQVREEAKAAGVSLQDWIANTVTAAVQGSP